MNRILNAIIGIMCMLLPIILFFMVVMRPQLHHSGNNWKETLDIFSILYFSIGITLLTLLLYCIIYIFMHRNGIFKGTASLWAAVVLFGNFLVLPVFGYIFFIRHKE